MNFSKAVARLWIALALIALPIAAQSTSDGPMATDFSAGTYEIAPQRASQQCLDVAGSSAANGVPVQIWACGGASNQLWKLVSVSGPAGQGYMITSANGGSCLDVAGVSRQNGAALQQWSCGGAVQTNQVWQPVRFQNGYELISLNSGKCLDVPGGNANNGARLQQWGCGHGYNKNQLWSLAQFTPNPTPTPVTPAPVTPAPAATNTIPGTYFGMTVLDFRAVQPVVAFGTIRSWDSYPFLDWAEANPSRYVYNFSWLDAFIAKSAMSNAEIIYTFGRTPQWASSKPSAGGPYGPGQCAPPANMADWDNYVSAVVTHAAGRIKLWELWNEPNDAQFYCGDIPTMVTMAAHAYDIIKRIDPTARVLTPSVTSTSGPSWLTSYLAMGAGGYADIIAFHGYWSTVAEDVVPVLARYHSVVNGAGQGNKPLWDTEASWAGDPSHLLYGDDARAAFAAKYLFLHWSGTVERFVWYAYDAGDLGSMSLYGNPTAAALAYATARQWLLGASMDQPCSVDASATWTCTLTRNGGYRAKIVWNSTWPVTVAVDSTYRQMRSVANPNSTAVEANVLVGTQPILLESSSAF